MMDEDSPTTNPISLTFFLLSGPGPVVFLLPFQTPSPENHWDLFFFFFTYFENKENHLFNTEQIFAK